MKKSLNFAIFVVFLLVPVFAYGQGSGSSESAKKSSGSSSTKNNFAITRSTSGVVLFVSNSTITIKSGSGNNNVFKLKQETRFIGGRPRKGDNVKVTYIEQNKQATSIRKF